MTEHPLERRPVGALDRGRPLGVHARGVARVLGRVDDDQGVAGLEGMHLDRRRRRKALERRRPHPGAGGEIRIEGDAEERVGIELGDTADDLLEQRTGRRRPRDEHLPAGPHADARVDEELGELTVSRVCHDAKI